MSKSILIIGGMGPQASLQLHQMVIDEAIEHGAKDGSDFPSITHLSLAIPDFISSMDNYSRALALLRNNLGCLWRTAL